MDLLFKVNLSIFDDSAARMERFVLIFQKVHLHLIFCHSTLYMYCICPGVEVNCDHDHLIFAVAI